MQAHVTSRQQLSAKPSTTDGNKWKVEGKLRNQDPISATQKTLGEVLNKLSMQKQRNNKAINHHYYGSREKSNLPNPMQAAHPVCPPEKGMLCYAMEAGSETSLPNPTRVALRCNGYKRPVNPPQGLLRDASARRAIPQQCNCLRPQTHRQHHSKVLWHLETNTSDPGKGRYAMLRGGTRNAPNPCKGWYGS